MTDAQAEVKRTLQAGPRALGQGHTRWRLADFGRTLSWLGGRSLTGIRGVLHRLGFSRKQAQNFIRSPDPNYDAKWRAVLRAFGQAVEDPEQTVLVFLDELTYYRRPTKAPDYHPQGQTQPRAHETPGANTQTRLLATLNGITAQVSYLQRSKIGIKALVDFYTQLRAIYPDARTIYVVQDNWPVHNAAEVLAAMHQLGLTPLFLPTYASWLNPIEKLWRWLRQAVLHLHRCADQLDFLRLQVRLFLDQFAKATPALLRYVGLSVD